MEIVPSRTSGKARKSKAKDPAAAAAKKERDAALARVREAVVARVRERFARDMKVLDACEALFAPNVDIETLENSGTILRQQDYQDCVKERTLRGLCGYPLCSASPSPTKDCGSSFTVILQRPGHLHTKVSFISISNIVCIVSEHPTAVHKCSHLTGHIHREESTTALMDVTPLPASSWIRYPAHIE
jgi:hypothetical protein